MKVVFCWSAISGYMAACWKELARRPGIELHVIAHGSAGHASFQSGLLEGLSHQLLTEADIHDATVIERLVADRKPDIVATTGWWLAPYRNLVHSPRLAATKFIMGVDSPWRHEAQFLTRLRYGQSLRKFDHFFVTGERSWQYVTRLGVPPARISRGMYGVDVTSWNQVASRRDASDWPRQFVFLGRYERVKAIDVLLAGYQAYRRTVSDPWPLVCCGTGPDRPLLAGAEGIVDKGFVQPGDLPGVLADSGAFVLPSRFDPWPLALVEAAATGLPVICTDACGSAVEVVRPFYNGLVVPKDSPAALAEAFAAVHERRDSLPQWGQRSVELSRPYATEFWANRWVNTFQRLMAPQA
jgi:glycosyltransferase involved in cell wall biosynthesis